MKSHDLTKAIKNRRFGLLVLVGAGVAYLGHGHWWRWLGLFAMPVAVVLWWTAGPGWWDEGAISGPWFRRFGGFGYRPTSWQGRAVIAAMAVVAIPSGVAWLSLADSRPTLASTAGAAAVLAALIGHVLVLWKMDWGYRRR